MKALKVLALLLILVGVVADASARTAFLNGGGILCGASNDPTLCDQTTGEDTGCSSFCSAACAGFTDVVDNCVFRPTFGDYVCRCHGTPVP
jgi:hypothetical protein